MKTAVASASITPLTHMLAAAALSAVICIALWQSRAGITVGTFASFITAMLMLIAPIKRLSEVASPISRGLAAVQRAMDLIEKTPAETGGTHAPGRAQGRIELQSVVVRYRDDGTPALDGITLAIEPGQVVALVGPSGSGKTTLANLLPRFVQPTEGRVLLDGHDVSDWRLDALRSQFALVSQDVVMFNDTLAANVVLGSPRDAGRAGRVPGRGESGWTGGGTARRNRDRGRPQRRDAVGRAAPAAGDRPRALQGRATADPGRSHFGAGQRIGAPGTGSAAAVDGRPHHADRGPPPLDHRACGRRGRAGSWQAGRKRQPCAVVGPGRALRAAARTAIRDQLDDAGLASRAGGGPGRARVLPAVFPRRGGDVAGRPAGSGIGARPRPMAPGSLEGAGHGRRARAAGLYRGAYLVDHGPARALLARHQPLPRVAVRTVAVRADEQRPAPADFHARAVGRRGIAGPCALGGIVRPQLRAACCRAGVFRPASCWRSARSWC